ncbi:MAG: hypothetical protein GY860_13880 [Desulfobacteraceae bacterium]|nr:hypothetical protein [Desulfobacteraceae bacterium]
MTPAEKKIIDKLSAKKKSAFSLRYSENNRRWFVWKIIQYYNSQGTPTAQIEAKTLQMIEKATAYLKTNYKGGFKTGSLKDEWPSFSDGRSRIQIIYGVIASHPKLMEQQHADYLKFIIERRFRMIKRMVYYVNPNEVRNIFAYPSDSCQERVPNSSEDEYYNVFKVNKSAKNYWKYKIDNHKIPPFFLSATGMTNPVEAIEKLFIKDSGCDKNLMPCDPVMSSLHLDSLLEAKDKDKLLKQLVTEGDHYVTIDHPNMIYGNRENGARIYTELDASVNDGTPVDVRVRNIWVFLEDEILKNSANKTRDEFLTLAKSVECHIVQGDTYERMEITAANPVQKKIRIKNLVNSYSTGAKIYKYYNCSPAPPYHILNDTRGDKALFEQKSLKANDLQVGDNLFVNNHPLYSTFFPQGAWSGEQSVITKISTRKITSTLLGNQMKVAGHGLENSLKAMINTMVVWMNLVGVITQEIVLKHLANIKANQFSTTSNVFIKPVEFDSVTYNILEYDEVYGYNDPRDGAPIFKSGFVILQEKIDSNFFAIYNWESKDSNIYNPIDQKIFFNGTVNNNNTRYKPENYCFKFYDPQTGDVKEWNLFKASSSGTPINVTLGFDDIKAISAFMRLDADSHAYVVRPRVDFSTIYQTYLKAVGVVS